MARRAEARGFFFFLCGWKEKGSVVLAVPAERRMSGPTVNAFEPPADHGYRVALFRTIAAYVVCEKSAAADDTYIDAIDDAAQKVESVITDKDAERIVQEYKSTGAVSLPTSVQRALNETQGKTQGKDARERTQRIMQRQERTRPVGRVLVGSAVKAGAEANYKRIAFCGALWHSGVISAILGILGTSGGSSPNEWAKVDSKIKQIESGRLTAITPIGKKANAKDTSYVSSTIGDASVETRRQSTMSSFLRTYGDKKKNSLRTSAFGAVHADAPKKFHADQADRVDKDKEVYNGENAEGFGPAFLVAYIHEVALNAMGTTGTAGTLGKLGRETAKFRLVAYASACVLHVLTKHIATCIPVKLVEVDDGKQLGNTILDLIKHHTAIPKREKIAHGTFQWLLRVLNGSAVAPTAATFAKYTDTAGGGAEIDGASLFDLVRKLANAEYDGLFSSLLSRTDDTFKEVFDAYMPDYKDKNAAPVTNAAPTTDAGKIEKLIALLGEVVAITPKTDTDKETAPLRAAAGPDKFQQELAARVKEMVDATWLGVELTADHDAIFERARTSVMMAKALKLRTQRDAADVYLNEIASSLKDPTGASAAKATTYTIAQGGLLDVCCAALEADATKAPTDITNHATENTAEAKLRRQILADFATEIAQKGQSLERFLAMAHQLAFKRAYEFDVSATTGAAGLDAIVTKSKATIGNAADFAALKKLVASKGDFAVALAHTKHHKLVFAPETDREMEKTANANLRYHILTRFPSALVEQEVLETGGGTKRRTGSANLSVDVLAAKKRNKETVDAEEEKALTAKMAEVRTLLDVGAPEVSKWKESAGYGRKLVYGVLFMDESEGKQDCWRLFVHVHGDLRTVGSAARLPMQGLLKAAYAEAANNKSATGKFAADIVFEKDEWGGVLTEGSTVQMSAATDPKVAGGKGRLVATASLERYKERQNVLFVHRWPELEFVPAPYAQSTPMFWLDESKFTTWPWVV